MGLGPLDHTPFPRSPIMAETVLHDLSSSNLFDLTGVVAVVTGGGTVRIFNNSPHARARHITHKNVSGDWFDDHDHSPC